MTIKSQIKNYIESQPELKGVDMQYLHEEMLKKFPDLKLWFLDGKDENGKVVSNPNIGYGEYEIIYSDGKKRKFYQIGMSANTTGISIYIMGLTDKKYLSETYSTTIGKASISGYCIKFKELKDINFDVLMTAIRDGLNKTNTK